MTDASFPISPLLNPDVVFTSTNFFYPIFLFFLFRVGFGTRVVAVCPNQGLEGGPAHYGSSFALVWFLSTRVWFGLVWFGLVWFGLVWFGLVWWAFLLTRV